MVEWRPERRAFQRTSWKSAQNSLLPRETLLKFGNVFILPAMPEFIVYMPGPFRRTRRANTADQRKPSVWNESFLAHLARVLMRHTVCQEMHSYELLRAI